MSITRNELKNIVKETISESYGSAIGNSMGNAAAHLQSGGGSHHNRDGVEDQLNDLQMEYQDIMNNLSGDPGYEQAIMICKCFVKNKPILQELLELMKSLPELQEEFLNRFRENQNM